MSEIFFFTLITVAVIVVLFNANLFYKTRIKSSCP